VAVLVILEGAELAVVMVESELVEDVNSGFSNVKMREDIGPADCGLASVGESLVRKSR
jgi:hypothetical protein